MAINEDEPGVNLEKKTSLTIINTNARSLCPKIESLIDLYEELEVDIGIVTEITCSYDLESFRRA